MAKLKPLTMIFSSLFGLLASVFDLTVVHREGDFNGVSFGGVDLGGVGLGGTFRSSRFWKVDLSVALFIKWSPRRVVSVQWTYTVASPNYNLVFSRK